MKTVEEIKAAIAALERQVEFCNREAATFLTGEEFDHDMYKFWIAVGVDYKQRQIALEWVLGTWNDSLV